MQSKQSKDTLRSNVKVAEYKTLHGLMVRQSERNGPVTRAGLRRDIGLGTVIFEVALQNLISGQLVDTCPRRGLTLTRKGMLQILENRTSSWT